MSTLPSCRDDIRRIQRGLESLPAGRAAIHNHRRSHNQIGDTSPGHRFSDLRLQGHHPIPHRPSPPIPRNPKPRSLGNHPAKTPNPPHRSHQPPRTALNRNLPFAKRGGRGSEANAGGAQGREAVMSPLPRHPFLPHKETFAKPPSLPQHPRRSRSTLVVPAQAGTIRRNVHPEEPGNRDATATSPFCVSKRGTRPAKRDAGGSYTRSIPVIPALHSRHSRVGGKPVRWGKRGHVVCFVF